MDELWDGPKSFQRLRKRLGVEERVLKAGLTKLIREGRVKKDGELFKLLLPRQRVYATIWYHPMGKYKLDEAIVVENGKTVSWAVGGSFYWHKGREKQSVLKEALLDFLFWDPELDEKENERQLEKLRREVEVVFVSDEEMKRLKRKYPEVKGEEAEGELEKEPELSYIG